MNTTGFVIILVLSNLLVYQFTTFYYYRHRKDAGVETAPQLPLTSHVTAFSIPEGEAEALPSILASDEEKSKVDRKIYGGENDKGHLGGFTDIDLHGISPYAWKLMINYFGVKSVLDIGCGRGISTSWFDIHGVEALCVEGSHDAVTQTMIKDPEQKIVEHDFSRGPWWPAKTYDAVWCLEFLEHVGRNFQMNYIPAFRKSAFIFATHSRWGGWHHVEVHDSSWWIAKMQSYGFVYSSDLTLKIREAARLEQRNSIMSPKEGEDYNAQHVWLTMMVFINPAVASLPQHQHLFAEDGCFLKTEDNNIRTRKCDGEKNESILPDGFFPLQISDKMDEEWENLVKESILPPESK